MNSHYRRGITTILSAIAVWLLVQPGSVNAHPNLIGKWFSPIPPPAGLMVYEFGPGHYFGDGTWKGPFSYYLGNCLIVSGTYELRMFTGTQGTIAISDDPSGYITVGNVDFSTRVLTHRNATFRP